MTFFYDLNKKLAGIAGKPETQQLNEGAHTQHALDLNPDLAKKKPGGIIGKIAQGAKKVADVIAPGDEDLIRDLERKTGGHRPTKEADVGEGNEFSGELAQARAAGAKEFKVDGKTYPVKEEKSPFTNPDYDPLKAREYKSKMSKQHPEMYDAKPKKSDGVEKWAKHKKPNLPEEAELDEGSTGDYSAKKARAGKDIGKPGKNFEKIAKSAGERYGSRERGEKVAGAVLAKLRANESVEEAVGTEPAEKPGAIIKRVLGNRLAYEPGLSKLYKNTRRSTTHRVDDYKLKDVKINIKTGKKYSLDSDHGDALAVALRDELINAGYNVHGNVTIYPNLVGFQVRTPISVTAEATKEVPGGRRHTAEPGGYGRRDDEEAPKTQTQRGRGRPKKGSDETGDVKKYDWSAFGVPSKAPKLPAWDKKKTVKHKMVGEGEDADIDAAIKLLKKSGYEVSKADEQVNEKAVSRKQQKFMGMVHAAQKGKEPASAEVAKVAREMPKKAAKEFAATKHKGLPEKKNKEVEETTVAGSVATATESPKSAKGMTFGKGIYDSMNRDLENLIAESMQRLDESININMSMNSDPQGGSSKSLTVTATDEDADKLAMMLKMAGIGQSEPTADAAYTDAACQVDENQPDWPTDTEYSDDALQYSGGLNKPKRDVAGDGQATGTITAVHIDDEDDEELRRIREMAGIRESKKSDFADIDNDGNEEESMSDAAKDKEEDDSKKVDESIFSATANLWKTYKG